MTRAFELMQLVCGTLAIYYCMTYFHCHRTYKKYDSDLCMAEQIENINKFVNATGLNAVPLAIAGWYDASLRERLETLMQEPVVIETATARTLGTLLVLAPTMSVVAAMVAVDAIGRGVVRLVRGN